MLAQRKLYVMILVLVMSMSIGALAFDTVRNRNHTFDGDYKAKIENRTQKKEWKNVPVVLEGSFVTFTVDKVSHTIKFDEMTDKRHCYEINVYEPESHELYIIQLKQ